MALNTPQDIVAVRRLVGSWAKRVGFAPVDLTMFVTAASELTRNAIVHGHGGMMHMQEIIEGIRHGLRLVVTDRGPGMADIEAAMQDGYSSGSGLGLGLSGAKRLVNEFYIDSSPEASTCITVIRWKRQ